MIKTFYFNQIRTCCYVISDDTKECVIIDPGFFEDREGERLYKYIEDQELTPKMILNTHGHADHIIGNGRLSKKYNIPIYMNHKDLYLLEAAKDVAMQIFNKEIENPPRDVKDLEDGQILKFGHTELKVLASPGHTPGGVAFYNKEGAYVMSGDSLFAGSIGRTDLPGGDLDTLMNSLKSNILPLPYETQVYPGHGHATEIGIEMNENPFITEQFDIN
ncbi:MAG: MBL fold metallo-hydrolase [Bacteroidales bacterium]